MSVPANYPVNKRSLDGAAVWIAGGGLAMMLGEYVSERLVLPVIAASIVGAVLWGRKRIRDEGVRLRAWGRAEAKRQEAAKLSG